jgi:tRNA/rRNA methyltransferase
MIFWTYMLRCSDGSYYTGHTEDLDTRLSQHYDGHFPSCYTYNKRPVEHMWSDYFQTRDEALTAERKIKGWSRLKKEALIRGDFAAIQRLAQRNKPFETGLRVRSVPPQGERVIEYSDAVPKSVCAEEAPKPKAEAPSRSAAPIIILVRPQLGENIGKAARAMLNFGLTEMRIVAPRDGWPNPNAGPAASGADIVLENAQVFDTLAEAVADISHVYATTVRKRGVTKPVITPAQAADEIIAAPARSAILFGAERSGLDIDEVAMARTIITVPINPEFGSLNLAQAVILCAYEWSKHQALASPPKVDLDPPAPQEELDGMIDQLFVQLTANGYFFPPARTVATKQTLRNLLTKPAWNSLEIRTLRGVLSSFDKRIRKPG